MNLLFADTFYFLALLHDNDAAHARAVALSEKLANPMLTMAWVLTEVADALAAPELRTNSLPLLASGRSCLYDRATQSGTLRPRSRTVRADKSWSLTDCISFVVMRQYGVTEALTGDRHFEQAGFTALLK